MERLSASPRITDIYGYCGATSLLEMMPHEVNEIIQPGSGRANQTLLDRLDNVYPKNSLTPYEKVAIALEMAEAIADLSGFPDGVIVHGDNHIDQVSFFDHGNRCQEFLVLHRDQFLANSNGFIKLGDFNLASILEWNDEKGEYCKREREPWAFRVSSLESISSRPRVHLKT